MIASVVATPVPQAVRGSSTPHSLVPILRLVACAVVAAGALVAYQTGDGHWVEKSGKLVVALSFLLTYAQFRFEVRHEEDPVAIKVDEFAARGVGPDEQERIGERARVTRRSRYDGTRSYILKNALVVAAVGELLSAFGGDLFYLAMPHV